MGNSTYESGVWIGPKDEHCHIGERLEQSFAEGGLEYVFQWQWSYSYPIDGIYIYIYIYYDVIWLIGMIIRFAELNKLKLDL